MESEDTATEEQLLELRNIRAFITENFGDCIDKTLPVDEAAILLIQEMQNTVSSRRKGDRRFCVLTEKGALTALANRARKRGEVQFSRVRAECADGDDRWKIGVKGNTTIIEHVRHWRAFRSQQSKKPKLNSELGGLMSDLHEIDGVVQAKQILIDVATTRLENVEEWDQSLTKRQVQEEIDHLTAQRNKLTGQRLTKSRRIKAVQSQIKELDEAAEQVNKTYYNIPKRVGLEVEFRWPA